MYTSYSTDWATLLAAHGLVLPGAVPMASQVEQLAIQLERHASIGRPLGAPTHFEFRNQELAISWKSPRFQLSFTIWDQGGGEWRFWDEEGATEETKFSGGFIKVHATWLEAVWVRIAGASNKGAA